MLQSFKFYRKLRGGLWIKTMQRWTYNDIYTWHHIKKPGLSPMGKVLSDHKIQGVIVRYEYYGEVSPWEIQAFIDCENQFQKYRIGHGDVGEISDGYHTFNELYAHRNELFAYILNKSPETSWKSRFNSDGGGYEGWFVAGFDGGTITYHLPISMWDRVKVKVIKKGEWDGHKSHDVLWRLEKLNSK